MPSQTSDQAPVSQRPVSIDGDEYLVIENYDRLPPFLMALAGDGDLWMFLSSYGGVTAGRRDADGAILPYVTADRLHEAHGNSGPLCQVRVSQTKGEQLWQPFDHRHGEAAVRRKLFKSVRGDRVVFEELHRQLGLRVRVRWASSRDLGWVRSVTLSSLEGASVDVEILDGFRDLLPFGASLELYQRASVLVNAYKRNERDKQTGLATFSLTSAIVDRPTPVQSLRANVVWSVTPDGSKVRIDPSGCDRWRRAEALDASTRSLGQIGAYWNEIRGRLEPGVDLQWHQVLDVGLDAAEVIDLSQSLARLGNGADPTVGTERIAASLGQARGRLDAIVASSDGQQCSSSSIVDTHHYANVLFNCMRGGVCTAEMAFDRADFSEFLRTRNRAVLERFGPALRKVPERLDVLELVEWADAQESSALSRLAREYLPLFFGRRHGDPSRPWNRFAIEVQDEHGRDRLSYEGNWRDIFQNWEGLAVSYPALLPSMVSKFLNASSADGFNPYRITAEGIEWEIEDPADPWSYIGYWGDHQIVYLTRLLEALENHFPGYLNRNLGELRYSYADIPYRLRNYRSLIEDPKNTVDYDQEAAARIEAREETLGTDGRLRFTEEGSVLHVSLLEKLLVPVLSKLSNLVLDGGIWMNTQRPEWNDANNALVGYGVSVVTAAHLRRHVELLSKVLAQDPTRSAGVAAEVVGWWRRVRDSIANAREENGSDDREETRRNLLDDVGLAYEEYRTGVYDHGFREARVELTSAELVDFFGDCVALLDETLLANRRRDGLFHSYNLLRASNETGTAEVENLQLMLEGQVAALSSGLVDGEGALTLIHRMFESPLYRADQNSFMLYPVSHRETFLAENTLLPQELRRLGLIAALLDADDDRLVRRDGNDGLHFRGTLGSAEDVHRVLDDIARDRRWRSLVQRDRQAVVELFDDHFDHRAFTGRSMTMYGYEGIGCIYWHMVAKLLLAIQEVTVRSHRDGETRALLQELVASYYRVRAGLGFEKTPETYGAFPTDPYSHTPLHGGAQQPGMTGQVKEEILTRFGELGVGVEDGCIVFDPKILRRSEFLGEARSFVHHGLAGQVRSFALEPGELGFSYLQTPVIYRVRDAAGGIETHYRDEPTESSAGNRLSPGVSRSLFHRRGSVSHLVVTIEQSRLWDL